MQSFRESEVICYLNRDAPVIRPNELARFISGMRPDTAYGKPDIQLTMQLGLFKQRIDTN